MDWKDRTIISTKTHNTNRFRLATILAITQNMCWVIHKLMERERLPRSITDNYHENRTDIQWIRIIASLK